MNRETEVLLERDEVGCLQALAQQTPSVHACSGLYINPPNGQLPESQGPFYIRDPTIHGDYVG